MLESKFFLPRFYDLLPLDLDLLVGNNYRLYTKEPRDMYSSTRRPVTNNVAPTPNPSRSIKVVHILVVP